METFHFDAVAGLPLAQLDETFAVLIFLECDTKEVTTLRID
jgi:hypothetical protein